MATTQTKDKAKAQPKSAKADSAKTAKQAGKPSTREQRHRALFFAPQTFIGPDEFLPQVNGYGTPIYSTVGSSAGI